MPRGGKRTRSGPPKTPTSLRMLRGNPGKQALPRNEPEPKAAKPAMPKGMSKRAQAAWKRLADELLGLGVLTTLDAMALEALCEAYADFIECRELIATHGRTFETETKTGAYVVRARPEVAQLSDAWRRFHAMAAEFGLTPSSRTRIQVKQVEERDPLEELLERVGRPGA